MRNNNRECKQSMNQLTPGSICWAAFLEMGARHENSPTIPICFFER